MSTLSQLNAAAAEHKLTAGAVKNIRAWLTEPRYAKYAAQVAEHVAAGKWRVLDDVFWTVIPFGTGGRRGAMYPIGSNAINDRTIGESAQGLATYVKQHAADGAPLSCAIAYDTRHRSRDFAELCASIMVAEGFQVYFLDGFRSTPELSFTIRNKGCSCGIMVTASHNPPSDNAVKAYWSTGGQLLPPHDKGVIQCVMNAGTIQQAHFADALAKGQVVYCQKEIDAAYLAAVATQSLPGPRSLKIIYSPMHGVGAATVLPALSAAGFAEVELFAPHAAADGDFPNVPGHVSNPENPATFDTMIQRARETGADLILSTDPDGDRLGCAAPLTVGSGAKGSSSSGPAGEWQAFNGNQVAALLTEFLLSSRKRAGTLSPEHYVVKTLVTTEMMRRIADAYGVRTYGNLLVGFKWIAQVIDEAGPERFVLGAEESHGYLIGTHCRDKDATVAAMLMAELAAQAKSEGKSLHEKLDALYWQYGCHLERTVSQTMPGSEGMIRMRALMARFRSDPPKSLAGESVTEVHDFLNQVVILPTGKTRPLDGPRDDLIIFHVGQPGNYVAVRPSGTEPKVKFYLFAYEPAELIANLDDTKVELAARLKRLETDLAAVAAA